MPKPLVALEQEQASHLLLLLRTNKRASNQAHNRVRIGRHSNSFDTHCELIVHSQTNTRVHLHKHHASTHAQQTKHNVHTCCCPF